MKIKTLVSALTAVCLTASTSAFAQNYDHQNDRGGNEQRGEQTNHDQHQDRGRNDRADYKAPARDAHNEERGAGPRQDMRRGGRIANEYRGNQYVVDDWRGHHLSAPPRGSHWVQTGGDYVLVAIASGIIAQVLLNN